MKVQKRTSSLLKEIVCPGRMSKENVGRSSLLIISSSDLGNTKQRCDRRSQFALRVLELERAMGESEKIIDGEDREEQISDYFYHLGPIPKAVVNMGCRSICSPDLILLTVSLISLSHYFPLVNSREWLQ